MLAYENWHTPEGIDALKVHAVESIREKMNGDMFMFSRTNTVTEMHSTSTIGYNIVGMPDIVFGLALEPLLIPDWTEAVMKLQRYMIIYGVPELGEAIDPIQFANFGAGENDPPITHLDQLPVGSREIRLHRIDAERWFAGDGWQHAQFYNEQERKGAVFLQWTLPDVENRYPTDVGYAGDPQTIYEALPFGQRWPNEQTPERIARNRYMH